jgi:hypothetical protein
MFLRPQAALAGIYPRPQMQVLHSLKTTANPSVRCLVLVRRGFQSEQRVLGELVGMIVVERTGCDEAVEGLWRPMRDLPWSRLPVGSEGEGCNGFQMARQNDSMSCRSNTFLAQVSVILLLQYMAQYESQQKHHAYCALVSSRGVVWFVFFVRIEIMDQSISCHDGALCFPSRCILWKLSAESPP